MKYANIANRLFVAYCVRRFRFSTNLILADLKYKMNITLNIVNDHIVNVERRDFRSKNEI